jgi:hypothetical protein
MGSDRTVDPDRNGSNFLQSHCQHREHTELVSPLFNEGAQMLPEGDQSWRLSPLFNEDDQDAQTN